MKSIKQWFQRLVDPGKHQAVTPAAAIDIEKTINDALTAAGLMKPQAQQTTTVQTQPEDTAEVVPEIDSRPDAILPRAVVKEDLPRPSPAVDIEAEPTVAEQAKPQPPIRRKGPADAGHDVMLQFANAAGSRNYAVHLPWPADAAPLADLPILVMLHGCTQSVADFATGTRMNALADRDDFLVVYPEQSAGANPSRCWNWFRKSDQQRGKGEPSLIAGIALDACARYQANPMRIFVAGLSAGGAMAVVAGDTYPEVFAAVASHSGLRLGAAHDVPSAFTAMKSGAMGSAAKQATRLTPTLVLQGDADRTVAPRNADSIIQDVLASAAERDVPLQAEEAPVSSSNKPAVRTVYRDAGGKTIAEYWRVKGGGHAWFGGDARGTYTDPAAPDASEAIVRFFGLHKT